ncbi:MAG TPA: homoserine O-succinyltransferase [Candidatus Binataceae bacterium]|nr:homoserine O-succinyltransferase [Candidatus Binataceae bacterium]
MILSEQSGGSLARGEPIVIGIVNNMPDAALRTTERQFQDLLEASSVGQTVQLRYFALPEVPRGEVAQAHLYQNYERPSELWESRLDGLIVTGTEPRAFKLEEEPYWISLTKLIDWAEDHTTSTVWSCLAAHAAVLHLDSIERQPLPQKLSGVFECVKSSEHGIVADVPERWSVPHSRYNGVPEELLVQRDYQILARSAGTGADLFIKHRNSLFVFFQGHPEYQPDTLLREYRRDVARFLTGERDDYPEMPFGYFDLDAAVTLSAFRKQALSNRNADLVSRFPTASVENKRSYTWREPAVCIYSNWIEYLATHKCRGANNGFGMHPQE